MVTIDGLLQLTQLDDSLRMGVVACIFFPDRVDTVIKAVLLEYRKYIVHIHKVSQVDHVYKW
jgi:hypothetical protein